MGSFSPASSTASIAFEIRLFKSLVKLSISAMTLKSTSSTTTLSSSTILRVLSLSKDQWF